MSSMGFKRFAWLAWVIPAAWVLVASGSARAEPVFQVLRDGEGGTNLLRNPGFESLAGAGFASWSPAPQGLRVGEAEGRSGGRALSVVAPSEAGWRGASQTLVLNRTEIAPLRVGGWSRAEGVTGGRDSGYSVYVDLLYADGTPLWGQTANFATGTHDWEWREVLIVPEKPVRSLTVHALFRGHAGRAWFDDLRVEEQVAGSEGFLFQGRPVKPGPPLAPSSEPVREVATGDGLALGLQGTRVVGVRADGRRLEGAAPGGFLVRDVGADSDVYEFREGRCAELGLGLEVEVRAGPRAVTFEGRVTDLRGADRAVLLLFALPLGGEGWTWGDDLRRTRAVAGTTELAQVAAVGCGSTGTMSVYPVGAVWDGTAGLALGLDQARPAQFRMVCHPVTRQLFVAFDLGLVPESERFPGAAPFRFVVYRFDPAWGFRSAWDRFMGLFPEQFEVRSKEPGIWMPFTDIATVEGWQDFGFRYHEGDNAVAWDDDHGILSFRYTEPMTWWMSMDPALPRTRETALQVRDQLAAGGSAVSRRMALVSRTAAMFEPDGQPAMIFRNEPWANGAVWSLNPNPNLPGTPNAATVYWNDSYRDATYGPSVRPRLDGEYLDSLEGYVTADLNFRRDHFRWTTVPLTFAADTRRPALFKGLAIHEFTRWISDDVRRAGGLMFANGVPYRFGFLCPWLDVLGTETDWMPGGVYQPPAQSQLDLWRTLSGAKPYLLLMNTDFDRFTSREVERYFQRCLALGFLPSMFSRNASDNPYWRNPAWYNRDRALFQRYIPRIREAARAGWQPVTGARCDDPRLLVERFGPGADGATLFTVHNGSDRELTGRLALVPPAVPGTAARSTATELLSGLTLDRDDAGWRVTVGPGATALVRLEPGPRFLRTETTPSGGLRFHIESPAGLPQVLEASDDLRDWRPVEDRVPPASPYVIELALADPGPGRFYRLRW